MSDGFAHGDIDTIYQRVFDPRLFGSTVNHVTINSAISAASAVGGGTVPIESPCTIAGPIVQKSNVWLKGNGRESATITLADGSNCDIFKTDEFDSLTGTGSTGGPFRWKVTDLGFNGNKANQSGTCRGMVIYGYDFEIKNVLIDRCKGTGLYSEWDADNSPTDPRFESAGRFSDIVAMQCAGKGFDFVGPHDSLGTRLNAIKCDGYEGIHVRTSGASGAGGMMLTDCHAWGDNTYSFRFDALVIASGIYCDGATTAGLLLGAGGGAISNLFVLGVAGRASDVGVQFGYTSNQAAGWKVSGKVRVPAGTGVAWTNETQNLVDLMVEAPTAWSGSQSALTSGTIQTIGRGSGGLNNQASLRYLQGPLWINADSSVALLVRDQAGNRTFAVESQSRYLEIAGGSRLYSGSGSPVGVVSAPVGSLYLRTDGGANTTLYVKESGTSNSGWVAK